MHVATNSVMWGPRRERMYESRMPLVFAGGCGGANIDTVGLPNMLRLGLALPNPNPVADVALPNPNPVADDGDAAGVVANDCVFE